MALYYNSNNVPQSNNVYHNSNASNKVYHNSNLVWQKQFFIYNNGVIGNNGNIWVHWSVFGKMKVSQKVSKKLAPQMA